MDMKNVFNSIRVEIGFTDYQRINGVKPLSASDTEKIFNELLKLIKIDKDSIINYVISNFSLVEYAVYNMFKYLANQGEHKMYLQLINCEYKKYKSNNDNMFSDWVQQFYLELLKTLNNNNSIALTDYTSQHLTKRQVKVTKSRLANGLFESANDFVFKIISYDILSVLRSQVRKTRKVEDNYTYSYCDEIAYLSIDPSLYDLESIQFFNFICSKVKINKTKKALLLMLIDNVNSTKYDFISRVADENNISSRTLRERKKVLKNTFIKSDLITLIRVVKTFKVKAIKQHVKSHLTYSNAKKLHLNKSYLNTYRYKYSDHARRSYARYKKQMKK